MLGGLGGNAVQLELARIEEDVVGGRRKPGGGYDLIHGASLRIGSVDLENDTKTTRIIFRTVSIWP
jgi:hypothetical protein